MASSTEQAIRVTAQGEFGQLQRGLKDLQGDLKGVLGEIDKGARRGGIFDDTQLRALDVYRQRFKDTLEDLNKEFDKQAEAVDALNAKMKQAYAWEKEELKEQIKQRQDNLNLIDRTRQQLEQTYQRRNTEAQGYGSSGSGGSDSGFAMLGAGDMLSKVTGAMGTIGKFALGLAGVGSLLGMATEAYQLAHDREVNSLDLAQRLRGNGFTGSNSSMYDQVSAIGRSNGMGYSQAESWQLQNAYTSEAGTLGAGGQLALQQFSRGYGLDATEVGGMAGNVKQMGGSSTPKQFADMIAGSVEKSGMVPRILEVMRAHSVLLQSLNTTFKDGASTQIMAYQTTLDRLGNENGMTRLTGAQGANVIGGLGGIYQPDSDKWKWMGITALQKYNPSKYKGMGLYDLESNFEDGMQNQDNIPAMAKYLKSVSGGNNDNFKRMMQSWLTDGGFKATKSEVTELDKVTNGFTAFDPDKINKVVGNSGAKYTTERQGEYGQSIMDVEAKFKQDLTEIGEPILTAVTAMKSDITKMYADFKGDVGFSKTLTDIYTFLKDSGLGLFGTIFIAGKAGSALYKAWVNRDQSTGIPEEDTTGGSSTTSEYPNTRPLTADERAMLDDTARSTGLNRTNLERAYRSHGDNGVDAFVHSNGAPPTGAPTEGAGPTVEESAGGSIFSRLGKGIKGAGGGIANALGFVPLAVQGLEVNKENPNASSGDFFGKLLDKMAPGWRKVMYPSTYDKTNQGDSDILTSTVDNTSKSLAKFSTDGTTYLSDLGTKGATTYTNLEAITSQKFDEIKDIHQKFFDALGSIYSVNSSVSGDSDVQNSSGATAASLNSKLKGKLSGYGGSFVSAGSKYGIDPAFLAAISMQETGNGSVVGDNNNVGGTMGSHGLAQYSSVSASINAMAQNLRDNYINQGLTTPSEIQKKYSPVGAGNDPTNLNSNWLSGVTSFYGQLAGSGNAMGTGAFTNWKNRITSPFHERRVDANGNVSYHSGLDLSENQGTELDALAGGKITDLEMDDGGKYDSDGKKNTRMGGTEMVVTMPDGRKYSYSHMSQVNQKILEQYEKGNHSIGVTAGEDLGNSGGTPGVAGSGYSTTGPHLHLGYMDANGNLQNPEDLLNSLGGGTGDSNILGGNSAPSQAANSHITVDVNLKGEGASQLNSMTMESLKYLIQQGIEAYKRQQLAMNPTIQGG